MKIFVGNLSFNTSDNDLRNAFTPYGQVDSAQVVTDRETMRSRGFGFVEMPDAEVAKQAIQGMNGTALEGRSLTVNEAKPREDRSSRGPGSSNRW